METDGRRSREHGILVALAPIALLCLVLLGVFLRPNERGYGTHEQLGLPACRTMKWFDLPCPGCGVTTSACLVVRGHPLRALKNQPLGFLLAVLVPVYAVWAVQGHRKGRDLFVQLVRNARRLLFWFGLAVLLAWAWKVRLVAGGG